MSNGACIVLAIALGLSAAPTSDAAVIHVPGDFASLDAAIAAAAAGDEIVVAAGSYAGPFAINAKPLTIRGAGAGVTKLVGAPGGAVLSISQVTTGIVRLEALTIADGQLADHGAGLRISGARVDLRSCSIRNNVAHLDIGCAWCQPVEIFGGGMAVLSGSEVTMDECLVDGNRVSESFYAWGAAGSARGGGIYVSASLLRIEDSEISNNQARGNDYPPPANQNAAQGYGAGICAEGDSSVQLTRVRMTGNRIWGDRCHGGFGAAVASRGASISLMGCMVVGNVSAAPTALNRAGGLYLDGGAIAVDGCTIWRNIASSGSLSEPGSACWVAAGSLTMRSTGVCGSGTQPIVGGWTNEGGVTFTDFCVDCNGNGVLDDVEIASGAAQDVNGNFIPDDCECLADLFVDGLVNGIDLGILLAYWGPTTASAPSRASDLNRDGAVDGADLGLLLSRWGPCGN